MLSHLLRALEISTLNGSITYYKYNGLGMLSEKWSPFEVANGETYYLYSKTEYYKNALKYKDFRGKDKVILYRATALSIHIIWRVSF